MLRNSSSVSMYCAMSTVHLGGTKLALNCLTSTMTLLASSLAGLMEGHCWPDSYFRNSINRLCITFKCWCVQCCIRWWLGNWHEDPSLLTTAWIFPTLTGIMIETWSAYELPSLSWIWTFSFVDFMTLTLEWVTFFSFYPSYDYSLCASSCPQPYLGSPVETQGQFSISPI